jgi:hypothetical protein
MFKLCSEFSYGIKYKFKFFIISPNLALPLLIIFSLFTGPYAPGIAKPILPSKVWLLSLSSLGLYCVIRVSPQISLRGLL